MLIGNLVIKV